MEIVFTLAGGLGFFLYGTERMSRGLIVIAGRRLKFFLRTITKNRFAGILSGALATAVIQSSSATTVIIVGFVGSGFMTLAQGISVMLGANIGTTITAQIIAFKIGGVALPIIALGTLLHIFSPNDKTRNFGEAIFGLGCIFFGITLMTQAFEPLTSDPTFQKALTAISSHALIGVLAGAVITALVQSSSVTTGIVVALAFSSAITLEQAIPLIIGQNIGTTVTAHISSLRGSSASKQASFANTVIKIIGAIVILPFLNYFIDFISEFSPGDKARQIANAHTAINVITTLLLLPFINSIAKFSIKWAPKATAEEPITLLEDSSLSNPAIALDQTERALSHMLGKVKLLVEYTSVLAINQSDKFLNLIETTQKEVERYIEQITRYLERISALQMSKEESEEIPALIRTLHEIERIQDYSLKMKETGLRMMRDERILKPAYKKELKDFTHTVLAQVMECKKFLWDPNKKHGDHIILVHSEMKERKDDLRSRINEHVIAKKMEAGNANSYYDIVSSLEEISKKCRNIAEAMIPFSHE